MTAPGVQDFVRSYASSGFERICFAWNGRHADEFEDLNQDFRFAVTEYVLEHPGHADVKLLADLFEAHSQWAREAWGAPRGFAEIGTLLLTRGGGAVLEIFGRSFTRSFDTFGACHAIKLDPVLRRRLGQQCEERLASDLAETDRRSLEAVRELLAKMQQGTASEGWATVPAGTPVTNIRIVRHRRGLWSRLAKFLRREEP